MTLAHLFAFIFGSIVGSFLNVCIYRMPRGESIIYPWSHCTNCHKSIPWYDNMPFISYLFLKGRCRFCMAKISFRYFIVEGLAAITFVLLLWRFEIGLNYLIYAVFLSTLIIISFIDLEHKIIPDELSLGGLALGLILSGLYPSLHGQTSVIHGFKSSFFGILVGGVSIYLIGLFGAAIFKKEAMGGGDIKLLAFIGAFLGWKLTLLTFFVAPILGSIFGIPLKFIKKQDTISYGPFLSLAAFISIFWGDKILSLISPI